jgi:cytochrome P450
MDGRFRKDGPGSPSMLSSTDGPSTGVHRSPGEPHAALRAKLAPLFTPSSVATLVSDVLAGPLDDLRVRLAKGDTVDLVDEMRLLAGAVICRVIGLGEVPATRARRLFADGERVVSMVSLRTRGLNARQLTVAHEVLDGIGDIAQAAYDAGDPTTVMGRMRELGLSAAEARGAAGAFFLTGTETVATFVPRLVALLHDHDAFGADLEPAIEEAMRITTPTPVMLRSVAEPVRLGKVLARPGDRVLIVTHNCARAYGPFDPSRPHPPELRRLWFGAGPHFCIGYPLALAEIRAVAGVVLARPVKVVARRAARGVLLPTYKHLLIRAA